ncbi:hypothetical protein, partial [Thiolapillus sp.]|uniref:hypothetical protein n=1 Tax=Thiolapillus sp. TaxID=2017437 RepID=UPI0025FAAC98
IENGPVLIRENGCGTEAAAKSTWMYLRRFSRNAVGGVIVRCWNPTQHTRELGNIRLKLYH